MGDTNDDRRRPTDSGKLTVADPGVLGVLAAEVVSYGALTAGSDEARAQVSGLSASDVSIATNDGEISSLTLTAELRVQWTNFETPVEAVEADFFAHVPTDPNSDYRLLHARWQPLDDPRTSHDTGWTLRELPLFRNTQGRRLVCDEFIDSTEGDGPNDTLVDVRLMMSGSVSGSLNPAVSG